MVDGHRDRRLLKWLLVAFIVVVTALYATGVAFASERLPRSTTVAGVDVGGRQPEDARRVLREALADRLDDPVRVVADGRKLALLPEEVGLDVDVSASVAQVPVGRTWSVADMWENVVGGAAYDAVVVSDDDLLTDRLTDLAAEVGTEPVEGTITFTSDGPEPTYPSAGTRLDVAAAAAAVRDAYPSDGSSVELPLADEEPEVTAAEVSRSMKEFANPAMSGPVTYLIGGEPVVLQPAEFAPALSVVPEDGRLEPRVDRAELIAALRPSMRTLADRPEDATVRIVDGRPRVVPAKKGVSLDADRIVGSFLDLVTAEDGERRLEMPARLVEPEVTTGEVRALGITERVSEFTTYYPHADYRNTNIGRAAALVDGTLLRPGETFSLNRTVGKRTVRNGFTEGFVISDGVFKEDLGGGVSQVATTIFNAAFFAGLQDVEHKPHSFYIDRYPPGREATVSWPTIDLRFRNDTRHGVLIETVHVPSTLTTEGSLTVRMWSTKVWDVDARTSERYAYVAPETRYLSGSECVPNEGYSGFQVDVTRIFRRHGESEVHHTERMHTSYTASDTVVCG